MDLQKKLSEFVDRAELRTHVGLFATPAMALLISLLLSALFILPTIRGTLEAYQEISKRREELSALTEKHAFLADLDEATIREQFEQVTTYLPTRKDLPLLFSTFSELESESGLLLQSVQVTPNLLAITTGSATREPESLDVSLSGLGDLSSLQTFLANVNASPVLMRVHDAQFSRSDQGGVISVQVRTYFLPHSPSARASRVDQLSLTPEEKEILSRL